MPLQAEVDYFSRLSTLCGSWLAWASMAVPACCRICAFVMLAVSAAKSVSWMRPRAADRFSEVVLRLATTLVKRFWIAPRSARLELIVASAESMAQAAVVPLYRAGYPPLENMGSTKLVSYTPLSLLTIYFV